MRKLACPLLLTGLFILLIALSLPSGCVYGSNTDWLSQHAALAETIRNACLEQNTLLPDFLALGGGSNGFQLSYYGYLRPDILIGCLLPSVPMYQILIFYSLTGYLASVLLFYLLLNHYNYRLISSLPLYEVSMFGWNLLIFVSHQKLLVIVLEKVCIWFLRDFLENCLLYPILFLHQLQNLLLLRFFLHHLFQLHLF